MSWMLVVTHAAAFAAGGVTAWWTITRKVRVREVDGHTVLELRHGDDD